MEYPDYTNLYQSDANNLPPPLGGAGAFADGGKLPSNGLSTDDLAKMSKVKKKRKKNAAR
jgi:hypothetical protein